MTVPVGLVEPQVPEPRRPLRDREVFGVQFSRPVWLLILAGAGMVLLSVIERITDSPALTSSGTFRAALELGVPIGVVGLGGLWAERAGVVNIGLEGMMILGTWFGAYAGFHAGPWQGLAFGVVGGALGGLVHAIATVWFGVDHIVSGVAINLLGAGVARYLSEIAYRDPASGGGATQSPHVSGNFPRIDLPFLSGGSLFGWRTPNFLEWLEERNWFLLSDIGGLFRGLTGGIFTVVIVGLLLFPLSWWVLWRTSFGLRLRSVGEDPYAAESLGVRVIRAKTIAVVVSGALAGFAGATLVFVLGGIYSEGQTAGRGFIGLAAMIFGNWRPGGLAAGAGLFGYTDGLSKQVGGAEAIHALLLFVAALLAVIGGRALLRKRTVSGVVTLIAAALVGLWWGLSDSVPKEFIPFTPHLTTLLVLAFAAQRLRMPAADGQPYRRGGR